MLPCPVHAGAGTDAYSPAITPSSGPWPCRSALSISLWLDLGGRLSVRVRGSAQAQQLSYGNRSWTLHPGVVSTVALTVAAGATTTDLSATWTTTTGAPKIESVTLVQGIRTSRLL